MHLSSFSTVGPIEPTSNPNISDDSVAPNLNIMSVSRWSVTSKKGKRKKKTSQGSGSFSASCDSLIVAWKDATQTFLDDVDMSVSNRIHNIHVDATFETVSVDFHLFLIIPCLILDKYPVFYVLVSDRTGLLYNAVFSKIRSLAPQSNSGTFVSDSETDLTSSIKFIWFQFVKMFVSLPPKFIENGSIFWASIGDSQRSCYLGQKADGLAHIPG